MSTDGTKTKDSVQRALRVLRKAAKKGEAAFLKEIQQIYEQKCSTVAELRADSLRLDEVGEAHVTENHVRLAGRVYALVGIAEVDENDGLAFHVSQQCLDADSRDALKTVKEDVENHRPLPSYQCGMHVPGNPLSARDIDAISDAISIRSDGKLLFREDADFHARLADISPGD